MEIEDTAGIIEALNRAAKASETWRVHRFTMVRESKTHGFQDVDVEVLDRGEGASPRYHVSAKTTAPDGSELGCSGNSENNLETAIAVTHWFELDK